MPRRSSVIRKLRKSGVVCLNRKQWGSRQLAAYVKRRSTHPMPPAPAPYHFLHLTVTSDGDTVLEGKEGARQIEGYGYSTPPMVSYQDLVTNEGFYFQGQDYGNKGTHTVNDKDIAGFAYDLNKYGYAVALMQNVNDEVTNIQVQLVAMVCAARELTGWVRKGAPVLPHRKFAYKSCPGDKAMAQLARIERLKNQYVREGMPQASRGARFDRAIKELELADKEGFRGKMRLAALASLRRLRPIRFV
jgi:hypothetical protein